MKAPKRITTVALVALFGFYACGEGEKEQNETTEATTEVQAEAEVETPEAEEETEAVLAFNGVSKGDYTLYGHSEIEAAGDESSVADMYSTIEKTGGFEGKINVTIDEVCQKAGCWVTFKNENDESVRVFFRDHFTIPTETVSGTEAILYGKAVQDTLTVDFQKHLLDDAAESGQEIAQAEYDAITEDKIETTFDCESILVKN